MTFAQNKSAVAFAFASLLVTAGLWTTPGLEPEALALEREVAGRAPAPPENPDPPVAWGLRLNGGVGGAAEGGAVWRAGLDAEDWLWRNIGIGVQFGYQEWGTLNWCTGDCHEESGKLLSIAASVSLRGNNPANFPVVSLALGLAWGHEEAASWCDYDPTCSSTYGAQVDGWGPYGSLTAAWVFHPGKLRPAAGAFAIGPMVRVDAFFIDGAPQGQAWAVSKGGWTATTGMALGFGVAGASER
jgi:hypothetical protein